MANEEHLAILMQGVEVWNHWRSQHPEITPDLSGAELCEEQLSNVHLARADLSSANLTLANLDGADLRGAKLDSVTMNGAFLETADLTGASLKAAKLQRANLTLVDLVNADLSDADLYSAILFGADLRGANLTRANINDAVFREGPLEGTDFSGADAFNTVFADVDLSCAIGLETIEHFGPSEVGISTLYKSAGKIPEAFLRGCGVPDDFIKFMPSLFGQRQAVEFYSCFISHSSKDQDFAQRLHSDLQSNHIRVWFAPDDLKIGDRFPERIEESIRLYDKLLLILSTDSIESSWVEREVRAALEKEESRTQPVLFPICLDDALMNCDKAWVADIRRSRHIGDFTRWKEYDAYQKSLERLLRDLQADTEIDLGREEQRK